MKRWTAGLVLMASLASVLVATPAHADAVRDQEYWLQEYGIEAAWKTTKGAGVTIAVIDTGVDGTVKELVGAVTGGTDFSGQGSSNGQTPVGDDNPAHGTLVASLAAGRGTGTGAGVIGAAPAANILAISIGFTGGPISSDDQIAQAVRYAVDQGADVINLSLTRETLDWPVSWDSAFLYAMDNDVVVVAAAGNRGSGTTSVGAPATMPGVLTVAGVDVNGVASFNASTQGITIGVAAPSEDLVGVAPGGSHVLWNGTSGATPIVAGIVALVRAAHPELDAANVINRIVATAHDTGAPGADAIYGFGLIDAEDAVNANVPLVEENPMGSLAEWITIYRRAESTPAPVPTFSPSPEPVPEGDNSTIAGPISPLGTLLPTVSMLRNVGVPLAIYGIFLLILAGSGVLAWRRFRSMRERE
ncbi:type VII secretion-associated serine protease mycosin [Salinibacterium amurskyense]|uniref:Type VII secretion-associated serine protease mycosin n=1 Tax=Salinibacterium amurskyense TaxID=205941 RepID=A0A2M9D386_9MICO|nr:S8 family serine peptidase [Salinibacterium amurskyense]PJJ78647.1 type VII secretion-associated serine protease mycosin [Salinibacterium amurskyense]GHD83924.1 type VII secretion-associated serine protease [Salinibacterium amurskyense]